MYKYILVLEAMRVCGDDISCIAREVYGSDSRVFRMRARAALNYALRALGDSRHTPRLPRCSTGYGDYSELLRRYEKETGDRGRLHVFPATNIVERKKRDRQYVEHEELLYWLAVRLLGLSPSSLAWGDIRFWHCVLWRSISRQRRMRVWRQSGGDIPFSSTCDSWNYAKYLVDAVLVAHGMHGLRSQLRIIAWPRCGEDPSLFSLIYMSVLGLRIAFLDEGNASYSEAKQDKNEDSWR